MRNLRTSINSWFDKLNGQWRAMPVRKQQRYILLLFSVYAVLSVVVLVKVCYDVAKPDNTIEIDHIENPVIRQDNSSVIGKDNLPDYPQGNSFNYPQGNSSNHPQNNPPNYPADKPPVSPPDSITTNLENEKYGRQ
ncbi:hypothetical protein [Proteiniphilum saccharofermentans]|uniref:hypothetical protein n=1 Tax=Proteiniphilum saccharofermentans TaxID=1642647 RepID=UPI0028B14BFE|nr:hypothetical protein [Proteiniphilum saccharofermentans]